MQRIRTQVMSLGLDQTIFSDIDENGTFKLVYKLVCRPNFLSVLRHLECKEQRRVNQQLKIPKHVSKRMRGGGVEHCSLGSSR